MRIIPLLASGQALAYASTEDHRTAGALTGKTPGRRNYKVEWLSFLPFRGQPETVRGQKGDVCVEVGVGQ